MSIQNLLSSVEKGLHPACGNCPWNPRHSKNSGFGVSCKVHGVDWSVPITAVSILIAQDPAGTTPEKTGKLCGFCNAQFNSDHSAQHGFSLWKAAVSLSESGQSAYKYMKGHYWTNAIMHGIKDDKRREEARGFCRQILFEQINLLSPQIIIATGKVASESLFDLGIISSRWEAFSSSLSRQVYIEENILPSGRNVTIFCTFHGSATSVNTHVAKLYSEQTEEELSRKIALLPNPLPARNYLRRYQGFTGEDKGMRVLLLHWIQIGEAIRHANE